MGEKCVLLASVLLIDGEMVLTALLYFTVLGKNTQLTIYTDYRSSFNMQRIPLKESIPSIYNETI